MADVFPRQLLCKNTSRKSLAVEAVPFCYFVKKINANPIRGQKEKQTRKGVRLGMARGMRSGGPGLERRHPSPQPRRLQLPTASQQRVKAAVPASAHRAEAAGATCFAATSGEAVVPRTVEDQGKSKRD